MRHWRIEFAGVGRRDGDWEEIADLKIFGKAIFEAIFGVRVNGLGSLTERVVLLMLVGENSAWI